MNSFQHWVINALVTISRQIWSCQQMLRELLKHHDVDYSAEDAAVLKETDLIKEAEKRLPKPPEQKQQTGDK